MARHTPLTTRNANDLFAAVNNNHEVKVYVCPAKESDPFSCPRPGEEKVGDKNIKMRLKEQSAILRLSGNAVAPDLNLAMDLSAILEVLIIPCLGTMDHGWNSLRAAAAILLESTSLWLGTS